MSYNFFTQNIFVLTNSDARELTITNGFFWQTNKKYPEIINQTIIKINNHYYKKIPKKDYEILKNSWNLKKLYPIYSYWDYKAEFEIRNLFPKNQLNLSRKWLMKINIDTIIDKPLIFFKHYLVMFSYSFYTITSNREPFNLFLKYSIYKNLKITNVEKLGLDINQYKSLFFEHDKYSRNKYETLNFTGNNEEYKKFFIKKNIYISIKKNSKFKIINLLNILINIFIHNFIWIFLFFIAFIFIIFKFYKSLKIGKIDNYYFFFLVICLSKIAAYSVVSLVEISSIRYIYPYKWQYILLSIMLFVEFINYRKYQSIKIV